MRHVIKARKGGDIYIATKEGWRIASALQGVAPTDYHEKELPLRLEAVRASGEFDEVWTQEYK